MGAAEVPPEPPVLAESHPDCCLAVLDMMARGSHAVIHVDASRGDVLGVPARLRIRGLPLRLGPGLVPPIPDLHVDHLGIRATLLLDGRETLVAIPWPAVWRAQGGGRGVIWIERVPRDLTEADGDFQRGAVAPGTPARGPLRLVP